MGRGKKRAPLGGSALAEPLLPRAKEDLDPSIGLSAGLSTNGRLTRLTPAEVGERLAEAVAGRDLVATSVYERDRAVYKEREKTFTDNVAKQLQELLKESASSDQDWREFIKIYAHSPHYSMTNMQWAWNQLAYKGAPAEGIVLSETGWKALGRTIKPDFKRRYRKEGEEDAGSWDDTYAAEMIRPMIAGGYSDKSKGVGADKAAPANPAEAAASARSASSTPQRRGGHFLGWRVFDVYHETATEGKDGAEMPRHSWYGATGSEEDAEKLWQDIEGICDSIGLTLEVNDPQQSSKAANLPEIRVAKGQYSREDKAITVSDAQTAAARSAAALSALCEHFGPEEKAKDDDEVKVRVLARESAAFALASLYNIHSESQAFAFLADVAGDDKALKRVSSDVHRRVSEVLNYLDPIFRAKARGEAELKGGYESRAKKRKTQKGKSRPRKSALAQ